MTPFFSGSVTPPFVLLLAAAISALALLIRMLRPLERRSMHVAWVTLALGAMGSLAWMALPADADAATTLRGLSLFTVGLGSLQVGVVTVFRLLLPWVGLVAPRIVQDLSVTTLSLAWGMLWLRVAGVDPSQLFATSAILTAVVAFAMQDTLGNVLGGVALQLDNSLRVGDWVRLGEVFGKVTDVRWRYTAIETRSGEMVIVPNSWLMKNTFGVVRPDTLGGTGWRRTLEFQLDASASPAVVVHAIEHAVLDADIANVVKTPEPQALLMETTAGVTHYHFRYWVANPLNDWPTDSAVRMHVLAALARAGVKAGVPLQERLNIKETELWHSAMEQREFNLRLNAIKATLLFATLPDADQQALAQHLKHAPFAQGDIMTRQGAVAHWLYLITQGSADVLVDSAQGPVSVATLHDGDFFGEMGMLTGEPRTATVKALTPVNAYRLDKAGFAQVLQARPEIARELSDVVAARHAEITHRTASQTGAHATSEPLINRILHFFSLNS